ATVRTASGCASVQQEDDQNSAEQPASGSHEAQIITRAPTPRGVGALASGPVAELDGRQLLLASFDLRPVLLAQREPLLRALLGAFDRAGIVLRIAQAPGERRPGRADLDVAGVFVDGVGTVAAALAIAAARGSHVLEDRARLHVVAVLGRVEGREHWPRAGPQIVVLAANRAPLEVGEDLHRVAAVRDVPLVDLLKVH